MSLGSRITSLPFLTGAFVLVTLLAAGPLRELDAVLQSYWARQYTPNWRLFLDRVPNAVAGQAVCAPVLAAVAITLGLRHRTWHPVVIAVAAEVAFFVGIGGLKVVLARSSPAAGDGSFFDGGLLVHGWHGVSYPSGHAAEAVLIYGAAAYLLRCYAHPDLRVRHRTFWIVLLIGLNALLVAFYLGYHWPTDLLGGAVAGGILLRLLVTADRWHASRFPLGDTARGGQGVTGSSAPRSSESTIR